MSTTVDDFLVGLKERITTPANQQLLDDAGFLRLADKVVKDTMVPLMLSVNQNYFVRPVDFPVVAGQDSYQIYYRSIGRGLRDLKLVQIGASPLSTRSLTEIAIEHEHEFTSQSLPTAYFFQGDWIILRPNPVSSNTWLLRQFINIQHSKLVKVDACGIITSISSNVVTCSSLPTTFQAGVAVDFIQGVSGSSILGYDLMPTNVTGSQLTFATAAELPTNLAVGDYVALAQQTPVIQMPDEVVPYMETMTAKRVLYAVSDFDGENQLTQTAADELRELLKILQPRNEGALKKIVNRSGLLPGRGYGLNRRRVGGYWA